MPQFEINLHKRANKFALILAAIILTALAKPASLAAQSPAGPLDAQEEAKISKMLAASGVPSISISIVEENGKTVYAKALGQASLSPDRTATPATRYAIGSTSKEFTDAALLLLPAERRL